MENPQTDFCGYSVPHPYVPKMNVRLQTHSQGDVPPLNSLALLKTGLKDMMSVCDALDTTFDKRMVVIQQRITNLRKANKCQFIFN